MASLDFEILLLVGIIVEPWNLSIHGAEPRISNGQYYDLRIRTPVYSEKFL